MAGAAGPNTAEAGLVFAYDLGNTTTSYIGEPSTNLALFSMQGSFNADYSGVTFTDAPGQGYQGRDAKRVVANSGQWNIYRYPRSGNYTNTSSTKFTYSFKIKWADGHTPYFSNGYIYVDAETTYPGITVRAIDNGWFWCYCTYNGTSSPPWLTGFSTSDNGTCLISDWQLEPGLLHPTQYITPGGTRSATQGLLDLTGASTINLTDVSFNSNAQVVFDGTNDKISAANNSSINIAGDITMELVLNRTDGYNAAVMHKEVQYTLYIASNGDISYADSSYWSYSAFGFHYAGLTAGVFHHVVATKNGSTVTIYVDGNVVISKSFGSAITQTNNNLYIGSYDGTSNYFAGQIPVSKLYNRALTANEVATNFQALRYRFGI